MLTLARQVALRATAPMSWPARWRAAVQWRRHHLGSICALTAWLTLAGMRAGAGMTDRLLDTPGAFASSSAETVLHLTTP
jgi:hypothetical protein